MTVMLWLTLEALHDHSGFFHLASVTTEPRGGWAEGVTLWELLGYRNRIGLLHTRKPTALSWWDLVRLLWAELFCLKKKKKMVCRWYPSGEQQIHVENEIAAVRAASLRCCFSESPSEGELELQSSWVPNQLFLGTEFMVFLVLQKTVQPHSPLKKKICTSTIKSRKV